MKQTNYFPQIYLITNKLSTAIVDSSVVYVTIGFDYNIKVWRKKWPPFYACSY
ncbi:MAG: hypothetical protein R2822_06235 [Spirosomataceae bacterium]